MDPTLRRTLSLVSWLFAVYTLLLALAASAVQEARLPAAFLFAQVTLLSGAGYGLWRPRSGAWGFVLASALGSLGFVAFDLHLGNPQAAAVDAAYPAVALALRLLPKRS
jgi:hypothetical protein